MLDWIAVIISISALIFSIMQFVFERNRNRKEATIHAFDKLEENDSIIYLFSLSKTKISDLVESKEKYDIRIEKEWNAISNALSLIEHFAVGANNKIYDLETLNAMAGNKLIKVFFSCEALIQYKRSGVGKEKNYCEFEDMVNNLINYRENKHQTIPQKDC